MANITNAQAIRFVNEEVRPVAERLRGMSARLDSILLQWNGGLNTLITNSAGDNIVDGRAGEGVSRLTGADIHNVLSLIQTISTALDAVGVPAVIEKPCVRSVGE